MATNKNLHYYIDKKLIENGYWNFDDKEKKEMVDMFLMEHVSEELKKRGIINIPKDDDAVDLFELLYLATPLNEKEELAHEYTHYALAIIGSLQGCGVIWLIEKDEDLKKDVKLCIKNDKLDRIVSHDETDPFIIFSSVYDYLKTGALDKSKQKKYEIS